VPPAGRLLLQELKKTETVKGSQPATFKSESKKSPDSVTVKKTEEVKQQGKPFVTVTHKYPDEKYESKTVSKYQGTEQPKKVETTDKEGNKIFQYSSGKRHFEYTESTKKVINFPQTDIVASGGTPFTYTSTKTVTVPITESKTEYASGAGPSYEKKWSYSSGNSGDKKGGDKKDRRWVRGGSSSASQDGGKQRWVQGLWKMTGR